MTDLAEILAGPPEEAAPLLLGAHLVSRVGREEVRVRLTEVEAYKGDSDPASHAFRGRTPRNGSMFEKPGTLYVYRSYGIHYCANSATGPQGVGWGILMRGGDVVVGEHIVRRRRGRSDELTNGPGKLCQALGIKLEDNGTDLLSADSSIRLEPGDRPDVVMATPRVGISKAKDRPWRFVAAAVLGS